MSTFTLSVHVNPSDLSVLKKAGYKLCIAKKVNNKYNTVWRGGSFLAHNRFQWTSRYQVFGTDTFQDGARVSASTETAEVKYGQTAVIDENGNMGNAQGTPDSSGSFTVVNKYGQLNIGVMGYLGGAFSPIFVSPDALVTGTVKLTPFETVLVWFDTTHITSTIVTTAIANSIEVEFTGGKTTRSVTYASPPGQAGSGVWSIDRQLRLAATYYPETNRFEVETPSAPLLLKMASLINEQSLTVDDDFFPLVFKATLEFHDADVQDGVPDAFAAYAETARPDGLTEWDVSTENGKVVVQLALDSQTDDGNVAQNTLSKFMGILHDWTGAQYKKLTFEAPDAFV
ncbi:hypothetical protein BC628DRAFT_1152579 [Trametes gibbosa]|nr:hypothetical protein BC628DRAFT_1152579 [Trametes gibbosa]